MTLEEVEKILTGTPKEVFPDEKSEEKFKQIKIACHPDKNPGSKLAEDLFKKASKYWEDSKIPEITIKSPNGNIYKLGKIIASGDVADIWKSGDKIVKISRVEGGFKLLKNEEKILTKLGNGSKGTIWEKGFPNIIDSFPVKDKIQKHINVFKLNHGEYHTLESLAGKLDEIEMTWIFRRILFMCGFFHSQKVIHGAITPSHVMVTKDRDILFAGFGHSVAIGETVTTISSKWRDIYPPEVKNKLPALPGTDLYMSAKTIGKVFDLNKCHSRIKTFLKTLTFDPVNMRPTDSWRVEEDWKDLIRICFGEPRFFQMKINES